MLRGLLCLVHKLIFLLWQHLLCWNLFSHYQYSSIGFLMLTFCMVYIFLPILKFYVWSMSLCKENGVGSYFLLYLKIYLLFGVFNPFTFNVIINMYVLSTNFLIFGDFCLVGFLLLFLFFPFFSCDLMTMFFCFVWIALFCLCVSLYI